MDLFVNIDAALPLSDTQQRCIVEQAGVFQLAEIKVGTVSKDGQVFLVNRAGFNEKLSGLLADLSFELGSVTQKPGFTRLFECDMFDENHVKRVTVFGR